MISRGVVLALAMCLGTEAFLPSRFTGARALNRQRSTNGAAQRLNMAAEAGVPLSAEWLDNDGIANLKDFNEYETMYKRSVDDPEGFWGDIADTFHWEKKWDTVVRSNFKRSEGKIENAWFEGGITNLCYNCLDRHVEAGHGDQVSEPAGRARGAGSPVRRTSSAPRRALARREESRVTEVAAAIAPRSARATGGAWAECVVRDVRGHAPGPLAAAATPPPDAAPNIYIYIYIYIDLKSDIHQHNTHTPRRPGSARRRPSQVCFIAERNDDAEDGSDGAAAASVGAPQPAQYTYAEALDEVKKIAASLRARGVQKGDRVAIFMPMVPELPLAMLACARIGAVRTPTAVSPRRIRQ